jgi:diguanylate cyclase
MADLIPWFRLRRRPEASESTEAGRSSLSGPQTAPGLPTRGARGRTHARSQDVFLFRHLLGALASLSVVAIVYLYAASGVLGFHVAHVFAALVALSVLVFTVSIVSGFNRRFADPSLTIAQMTVSGIAMAYLAYASGPFRALQLPFYLIALLFGAFRLTMRQQLAISVYFVATFGAAIGFANWIESVPALPQHGATSLPGGITLVGHLALLLLLMSVIGGYVNDFGLRLRASNLALKQALERIERIATYDELTGLYNRRVINEIAVKEKKRSDRSGASLCIAMLDVDHFKRFNDLYGHSGGDNVLRMLSAVLQGTLRETEHVGRYGGEEFIVVLPETTHERAAIPLERLRQAISVTTIDGLPADVCVTVSIGVAEYRRHEDILKTIARADGALYEAKRAGRDRIVWDRA